MNLNPDPLTALLNREIARRDSVPPFALAKDLPVAFLEVKNGVARVCAYHGRDRSERVENSKHATDWCAAHGWKVSHGMCPECFDREMADFQGTPAPQC